MKFKCPAFTGHLMCEFQHPTETRSHIASLPGLLRGLTMNLQTHIRDSLWSAIQSTYQAKNYNHAILDAIHHLSNVLRDKTGVDGDGGALAGQALGGDSPRLRINRLQTETEKNEQRGMENILRGVYQAIRNPRSHEQVEDTQGTADAIIYFIDYLLGILEKSREPFVMAHFLTRVFDPDFYHSHRYAELLVGEIPTNKRFDTLIELYRNKPNGNINDLSLIIHILIGKLTDEQRVQYLEIVSDELSEITDDVMIIWNLNLLPPILWNQLSELSRLRIENRIIKSIREGNYYEGIAKGGALAIWARKHFQNFALKEQVGNALIKKLEEECNSSTRYVTELFLLELPIVITFPLKMTSCMMLILNSIKNGDEMIRQTLLRKFYYLPENWQNAFKHTLKTMTDEVDQPFYLPDGNLFSELFDNDDDIPF
jgi:uncharacterized protein (TIGR02391 family)